MALQQRDSRGAHDGGKAPSEAPGVQAFKSAHISQVPTPIRSSKCTTHAQKLNSAAQFGKCGSCRSSSGMQAPANGQKHGSISSACKVGPRSGQVCSAQVTLCEESPTSHCCLLFNHLHLRTLLRKWHYQHLAHHRRRQGAGHLCHGPARHVLALAPVAPPPPRTHDLREQARLLLRTARARLRGRPRRGVPTVLGV